MLIPIDAASVNPVATFVGFNRKVEVVAPALVDLKEVLVPREAVLKTFNSVRGAVKGLIFEEIIWIE